MSVPSRTRWASLVVSLVVLLASFASAGSARAATTWSKPTTIAPAKNLAGVACATVKLCVAARDDGYARIYNGTSWSAAKRVVKTKYIAGVECRTNGVCVLSTDGKRAVYYLKGKWHALALPEAGDVSCASATSCVLVGGAKGADSGESWFRVLRKGKWSAHRTFYDADYSGDLTCVTPTFCAWSSSNGRAFGTWNGKVWTLKEGLFPIGFPIGLSCSSASHCVATTSHPYVEGSNGDVVGFDGTRWTKTSGWKRGGNLGAVSCATATTCVIGTTKSWPDGDGEGSVTTFGKGRYSRPTAIDEGHDLTALSCVGTSFCLASDDAGRVLVRR